MNVQATKSALSNGSPFSNVNVSSGLASTVVWNVLIADDEECIRELIRRVLAVEPRFVISEATNGQMVIDRAVAKRPDLVFLGLHGPGLSGFTVCKKLKSIWADKVKVVIVSAIIQESVKRQARSLGADDYLEKPFSLGLIMSTARTLLDSELARAAGG